MDFTPQERERINEEHGTSSKHTSAPTDQARFNPDTVSYFKMLSDQLMGVEQVIVGASNLDTVKGALAVGEIG